MLHRLKLERGRFRNTEHVWSIDRLNAKSDRLDELATTLRAFRERLDTYVLTIPPIEITLTSSSFVASPAISTVPRFTLTPGSE